MDPKEDLKRHRASDTLSPMRFGLLLVALTGVCAHPVEIYQGSDTGSPEKKWHELNHWPLYNNASVSSALKNDSVVPSSTPSSRLSSSQSFLSASLPAEASSSFSSVRPSSKVQSLSPSSQANVNDTLSRSYSQNDRTSHSAEWKSSSFIVSSFSGLSVSNSTIVTPSSSAPLRSSVSVPHASSSGPTGNNTMNFGSSSNPLQPPTRVTSARSALQSHTNSESSQLNVTTSQAVESAPRSSFRSGVNFTSQTARRKSSENARSKSKTISSDLNNNTSNLSDRVSSAASTPIKSSWTSEPLGWNHTLADSKTSQGGFSTNRRLSSSMLNSTVLVTSEPSVSKPQHNLTSRPTVAVSYNESKSIKSKTSYKSVTSSFEMSRNSSRSSVSSDLVSSSPTAVLPETIAKPTYTSVTTYGNETRGSSLHDEHSSRMTLSESEQRPTGVTGTKATQLSAYRNSTSHLLSVPSPISPVTEPHTEVSLSTHSTILYQNHTVNDTGHDSTKSSNSGGSSLESEMTVASSFSRAASETQPISHFITSSGSITFTGHESRTESAKGPTQSGDGSPTTITVVESGSTFISVIGSESSKHNFTSKVSGDLGKSGSSSADGSKLTAPDNSNSKNLESTLPTSGTTGPHTITLIESGATYATVLSWPVSGLHTESENGETDQPVIITLVESGKRYTSVISPTSGNSPSRVSASSHAAGNTKHDISSVPTPPSSSEFSLSASVVGSIRGPITTTMIYSGKTSIYVIEPTHERGTHSTVNNADHRASTQSRPQGEEASSSVESLNTTTLLVSETDGSSERSTVTFRVPGKTIVSVITPSAEMSSMSGASHEVLNPGPSTITVIEPGKTLVTVLNPASAVHESDANATVVPTGVQPSVTMESGAAEHSLRSPSPTQSVTMITTTVVIPCSQKSCQKLPTTTLYTTVCTFTVPAPTSNECATITALESTVVVSDNSINVVVSATVPCTLAGESSKAGAPTSQSPSVPHGTSIKSGLAVSNEQSLPTSGQLTSRTGADHSKGSSFPSSRKDTETIDGSLSTLSSTIRPSKSSSAIYVSTVSTLNQLTTQPAFTTVTTTVTIPCSHKSCLNRKTQTVYTTVCTFTVPLSSGTACLAQTALTTRVILSQNTKDLTIPVSIPCAELSSETSALHSTGLEHSRVSSSLASNQSPVPSDSATVSLDASSHPSSPVSTSTPILGSTTELPGDSTRNSSDGQSSSADEHTSQSSPRLESSIARSSLASPSSLSLSEPFSTGSHDGSSTPAAKSTESSKLSITKSDTSLRSAESSGTPDDVKSSLVGSSPSRSTPSTISPTGSVVNPSSTLTTTITVPCSHTTCLNQPTSIVYTTVCTFTLPAPAPNECATRSALTTHVTLSQNTRLVTIPVVVPCSETTSLAGSSIATETELTSGNESSPSSSSATKVSPGTTSLSQDGVSASQISNIDATTTPLGSLAKTETETVPTSDIKSDNTDKSSISPVKPVSVEKSPASTAPQNSDSGHGSITSATATAHYSTENIGTLPRSEAPSFVVVTIPCQHKSICDRSGYILSTIYPAPSSEQSLPAPCVTAKVLTTIESGQTRVITTDVMCSPTSSLPSMDQKTTSTLSEAPIESSTRASDFSPKLTPSEAHASNHSVPPQLSRPSSFLQPSFTVITVPCQHASICSRSRYVLSTIYPAPESTEGVSQCITMATLTRVDGDQTSLITTRLRCSSEILSVPSSSLASEPTQLATSISQASSTTEFRSSEVVLRTSSTERIESHELSSFAQVASTNSGTPIVPSLSSSSLSSRNTLPTSAIDITHKTEQTSSAQPSLLTESSLSVSVSLPEASSSYNAIESTPSASAPHSPESTTGRAAVSYTIPSRTSPQEYTSISEALPESSLPSSTYSTLHATSPSYEVTTITSTVTIPCSYLGGKTVSPTSSLTSIVTLTVPAPMSSGCLISTNSLSTVVVSENSKVITIPITLPCDATSPSQGASRPPSVETSSRHQSSVSASSPLSATNHSSSNQPHESSSYSIRGTVASPSVGQSSHSNSMSKAGNETAVISTTTPEAPSSYSRTPALNQTVTTLNSIPKEPSSHGGIPAVNQTVATNTPTLQTSSSYSGVPAINQTVTTSTTTPEAYSLSKSPAVVPTVATSTPTLEASSSYVGIPAVNQTAVESTNTLKAPSTYGGLSTANHTVPSSISSLETPSSSHAVPAVNQTIATTMPQSHSTHSGVAVANQTVATSSATSEAPHSYSGVGAGNYTVGTSFTPPETPSSNGRNTAVNQTVVSSTSTPGVLPVSEATTRLLAPSSSVIYSPIQTSPSFKVSTITSTVTIPCSYRGGEIISPTSSFTSVITLTVPVPIRSDCLTTTNSFSTLVVSENSKVITIPVRLPCDNNLPSQGKSSSLKTDSSRTNDVPVQSNETARSVMSSKSTAQTISHSTSSFAPNLNATTSQSKTTPSTKSDVRSLSLSSELTRVSTSMSLPQSLLPNGTSAVDTGANSAPSSLSKIEPIPSASTSSSGSSAPHLGETGTVPSSRGPSEGPPSATRTMVSAQAQNKTSVFIQSDQAKLSTTGFESSNFHPTGVSVVSRLTISSVIPTSGDTISSPDEGRTTVVLVTVPCTHKECQGSLTSSPLSLVMPTPTSSNQCMTSSAYETLIPYGTTSRLFRTTLNIPCGSSVFPINSHLGSRQSTHVLANTETSSQLESSTSVTCQGTECRSIHASTHVPTPTSAGQCMTSFTYTTSLVDGVATTTVVVPCALTAESSEPSSSLPILASQPGISHPALTNTVASQNRTLVQQSSYTTTTSTVGLPLVTSITGSNLTRSEAVTSGTSLLTMPSPTMSAPLASGEITTYGPGESLTSTLSIPCTSEICTSSVIITVCSMTVPPTTSPGQCVTNSRCTSVVVVEGHTSSLVVPVSIPCGSSLTIPSSSPLATSPPVGRTSENSDVSRASTVLSSTYGEPSRIYESTPITGADSSSSSANTVRESIKPPATAFTEMTTSQSYQYTSVGNVTSDGQIYSTSPVAATATEGITLVTSVGETPTNEGSSRPASVTFRQPEPTTVSSFVPTSQSIPHVASTTEPSVISRATDSRKPTTTYGPGEELTTTVSIPCTSDVCTSSVIVTTCAMSIPATTTQGQCVTESSFTSTLVVYGHTSTLIVPVSIPCGSAIAQPTLGSMSLNSISRHEASTSRATFSDDSTTHKSSPLPVTTHVGVGSGTSISANEESTTGVGQSSLGLTSKTPTGAVTSESLAGAPSETSQYVTSLRSSTILPSELTTLRNTTFPHQTEKSVHASTSSLISSEVKASELPTTTYGPGEELTTIVSIPCTSRECTSTFYVTTCSMTVPSTTVTSQCVTNSMFTSTLVMEGHTSSLVIPVSIPCGSDVRSHSNTPVASSGTEKTKSKLSLASGLGTSSHGSNPTTESAITRNVASPTPSDTTVAENATLPPNDTTSLSLSPVQSQNEHSKQTSDLFEHTSQSIFSSSLPPNSLEVVPTQTMESVQRGTQQVSSSFSPYSTGASSTDKPRSTSPSPLATASDSGFVSPSQSYRSSEQASTIYGPGEEVTTTLSIPCTEQSCTASNVITVCSLTIPQTTVSGQCVTYSRFTSTLTIGGRTSTLVVPVSIPCGSDVTRPRNSATATLVQPDTQQSTLDTASSKGSVLIRPSGYESTSLIELTSPGVAASISTPVDTNVETPGAVSVGTGRSSLGPILSGTPASLSVRSASTASTESNLVSLPPKSSNPVTASHTDSKPLSSSQLVSETSIGMTSASLNTLVTAQLPTTTFGPGEELTTTVSIPCTKDECTSSVYVTVCSMTVPQTSSPGQCVTRSTFTSTIIVDGHTTNLVVPVSVPCGTTLTPYVSAPTPLNSRLSTTESKVLSPTHPAGDQSSLRREQSSTIADIIPLSKITSTGPIHTDVMQSASQLATSSVLGSVASVSTQISAGPQSETQQVDTSQSRPKSSSATLTQTSAATPVGMSHVRPSEAPSFSSPSSFNSGPNKVSSAPTATTYGPGEELTTTLSVPCTSDVCVSSVFVTVCSLAIPSTTTPGQCVTSSTFVSTVVVNGHTSSLQLPVNLPCGSVISPTESKPALTSLDSGHPTVTSGSALPSQTSIKGSPSHRSSDLTVVATSSSLPITSKQYTTTSTLENSTLSKSSLYKAPTSTEAPSPLSSLVSTPVPLITEQSSASNASRGEPSTDLITSFSNGGVSQLPTKTYGPGDILTTTVSIPCTSDRCASSAIVTTCFLTVPPTTTAGQCVTVSQFTSVVVVSGHSSSLVIPMSMPCGQRVQTGTEAIVQSSKPPSTDLSPSAGVTIPAQSTDRSASGPASQNSVATSHAPYISQVDTSRGVAHTGSSLLTSAIVSSESKVETTTHQLLSTEGVLSTFKSASSLPHSTPLAPSSPSEPGVLSTSNRRSTSSIGERSSRLPQAPSTTYGPGEEMTTSVSIPCTKDVCTSSVYVTLCSLTVPSTTTQGQCVTNSVLTSTIVANDHTTSLVVPVLLPCGSELTSPLLNPSTVLKSSSPPRSSLAGSSDANQPSGSNIATLSGSQGPKASASAPSKSSLVATEMSSGGQSPTTVTTQPVRSSESGLTSLNTAAEPTSSSSLMSQSGSVTQKVPATTYGPGDELTTSVSISCTDKVCSSSVFITVCSLKVPQTTAPGQCVTQQNITSIVVIGNHSSTMMIPASIPCGSEVTLSSSTPTGTASSLASHSVPAPSVTSLIPPSKLASESSYSKPTAESGSSEAFSQGSQLAVPSNTAQVSSSVHLVSSVALSSSMRSFTGPSSQSLSQGGTPSIESMPLSQSPATESSNAGQGKDSTSFVSSAAKTTGHSEQPTLSMASVSSSSPQTSSDLLISQLSTTNFAEFTGSRSNPLMTPSALTSSKQLVASPTTSKESGVVVTILTLKPSTTCPTSELTYLVQSGTSILWEGPEDRSMPPQEATVNPMYLTTDQDARMTSSAQKATPSQSFASHRGNDGFSSSRSAPEPTIVVQKTSPPPPQLANRAASRLPNAQIALLVIVLISSL